MPADRELAEFREMIEDFSETSRRSATDGGGMGGAGEPLDAEILFYMKLAESYALPSENSGGRERIMHPTLIPLGNRIAFSGYRCLDEFRKIMPGVTQTWKKRKEREGGRLRRHRLSDRHRFFRKHDQPRKNLSYAVLEQPARPMPICAIIEGCCL